MGDIRLLEDADWEWRRRGPTHRALRAFGVRDDALRRLPGGAGHTWTDGRLGHCSTGSARPDSSPHTAG